MNNIPPSLTSAYNPDFISIQNAITLLAAQQVQPSMMSHTISPFMPSTSSPIPQHPHHSPAAAIHNSAFISPSPIAVTSFPIPNRPSPFIPPMNPSTCIPNNFGPDPALLSTSIPAAGTLPPAKKRRSKHEQSGRNYVCGCGKTYLSYPALYTHVKTKHNGSNPSGTNTPTFYNGKGRGRGRPRKVLSFEFIE